MKILLAGATGPVGLAILNSLLSSIYITHIYTLTRRPLSSLPETSLKLSGKQFSKITEIVISESDFETWPSTHGQRLRDAGVRGCIWCIGGAVSKLGGYDAASRVNVGFAVAAAEGIIREFGLSDTDEQQQQQQASKGKKDKKEPFRFIYMSMSGAEQNPFRSLWLDSENRHVKGAAEKALLDISRATQFDSTDNTSAAFEVYVFRLGKLLAGGQSVGNVIAQAVSASVSAERVGKRATDVVLDGWGERYVQGERGPVLENTDVLGADWADINTIS